MLRNKAMHMASKKGLLISPAFPADSFWSFKYVIRKYAGRKTAFAPLGLLTFAALMPQDEWEFELIDLDVVSPGAKKLRRKIQEADAVFASAMNIQRDSLVELLDGPARGTDTPCVLGGPMASTYRDTILYPKTDSDRILHQGLDHLVWGEAAPWIEDLNRALADNPTHTDAAPRLFIPERVLAEPSGSRRYLQDKTIFRPLDNLPPPRWDLIDTRKYRSMMIQTTAGCRFRCNFCDIVQFNGGFARAKDKIAVMRELQAIYDTGFRGGVFTVDDNFVSEPDAMEGILEGMIEFQRLHNYPFHFFTQASIDLGKEELAHLLPMMRQAGFTSVFLGVENPDPEALQAMNKIQNLKTKPQETISRLQANGMEVYAGFIFGSDSDTKQTADLIVDFVQGNSIFSSMTGKLTPMPHTPLYTELSEQGRLLEGVEGGDARNNVDETLQYRPIMGTESLHEGFTHILTSLFNRATRYDRARGVLERVDVHIFRQKSFDRHLGFAAVRSLLVQGLRGADGYLDREYFRLLRDAVRWDRKLLRENRVEAQDLARFWQNITSSAREYIELDPQSVKQFTRMLDYAQEALVRYGVDRGLSEIRDFVLNARESLSEGTITLEKAQSVYDRSMDYLNAKSRIVRFPGASLVKAIELAVMGWHYRTVVDNVLAGGDEEGLYVAP